MGDMKSAMGDLMQRCGGWRLMADGKAEVAACLDRALELARRGEGHTRPNPPVGAVIVRGGRIVGEGYHRRAGTNHAETAAIADAKRRGQPTEGATIYVTLEPCSKPGRVGACTDAIVAAGIKSVFYAVPDPNPVNRGRAKRVLAKAGVECRCLATDCRATWAKPKTSDEAWLGDLVRAAQELIRPFAKHVTTGRPYVTVKLAMSLDGKICDDKGDAKWISSAASRRLTGRSRECVDAIMVGAETVRKDNPSLLSHGRRNDDLLRVVVSRSGRLPQSAQVFTDGRNPTLVFRSVEEALDELGRRGCLHVLCEGGLSLARALADRNLVDAWRLVTAPIVVGSRSISQALRFSLVSDGLSDPGAGDRIADYRREKP